MFSYASHFDQSINVHLEGVVAGLREGLESNFLMRLYVFVTNGPKTAPFSKIPVPLGTVYHGGPEFDGPRAWKSTFCYGSTLLS